MNRRNFVIGLGTVAAGSAAAVGTGAFTSATAPRDVDIEVADDATGYLGLTADGDYVTDDSDGGAVGIDLGGTDASNRPEGGEAFNREAETVVEDIVTVENQGSGAGSEVDVSFDGDEEATFELESTDGTEAEVTLEFGGDVSLEPGEDVGIKVTVDTSADVSDPVQTAGVTISATDDTEDGIGGT